MLWQAETPLSEVGFEFWLVLCEARSWTCGSLWVPSSSGYSMILWFCDSKSGWWLNWCSWRSFLIWMILCFCGRVPTQHLLHSSGRMKLPGASAGEDQAFRCRLLVRNGKDKVFTSLSTSSNTVFKIQDWNEQSKRPNFHNWKMKKHNQLFSYESCGPMKMHLSLSWITCSLSCQHTCHLLAEAWTLQWCRVCRGEPGCHRLQEGNGGATVGKNWTRDPHTSHVSSVYRKSQITYTPVAEEVLRFVLLNCQQDRLQCTAQKVGLHLGGSQNHVGLDTGCCPMKPLMLCAAAPTPVKVSPNLTYLRGISTPIH